MDDVGSSGGQEPGILHQTVAKQIKICVCLLRTDTCLSCRSEKELGQSLQYWEECFSLNSEVVPTCLQPMADKVSVCVCVSVIHSAHQCVISMLLWSQVLVAGKSMHLIESFGKVCD